MTRKLMLTAVLLTAAFVVWGINELYKGSALPYSNATVIHREAK